MSFVEPKRQITPLIGIVQEMVPNIRPQENNLQSRNARVKKRHLITHYQQQQAVFFFKKKARAYIHMGILPHKFTSKSLI